MREHISRQKKTTTGFSIPSLKHPIRGFGLESSVISRQAVPEVQPINKPVTHDISRIPLRSPQAKLSISQPGDIYEQEADSVAQQVMQTMAQPVNPQSIQREALPEEEELQMKPLDISTLQREALPEDEEELQMKSMVQRQAGMVAALDLEASINQARGGGVAMADNIRQPMEQAFGADFSRVKVHTDGQSDQLNRSIAARAFTMGQDVFFGQGEYNPGSRGGQELLAHELTHVVQQSNTIVRRKPYKAEDRPLEVQGSEGEKNDHNAQNGVTTTGVIDRRKDIQRTTSLYSDISSCAQDNTVLMRMKIATGEYLANLLKIPQMIETTKYTEPELRELYEQLTDATEKIPTSVLQKQEQEKYQSEILKVTTLLIDAINDDEYDVPGGQLNFKRTMATDKFETHTSSDGRWHFTYFYSTHNYHLKGNKGTYKAYQEGDFGKGYEVRTSVGNKNASSAAIEIGQAAYKHCKEVIVPAISLRLSYL
ncbi:eCIS core domain-containing protein [Nostoc sp.]|uniref:eCIS core domain-containing protein n=1 Tax=Nostoc sp. TaxID=1180 RepID=UPI002FF8C965